ncbi:MAG: glutamate--tRNA ligase family protein [Phycisphaerales bacterium]|jgi:glutamyl-tRNA synthetase|nr:glutamate--tRNA ligase family protein [Phycisphaerales bacterium]
MGRRSRLAPSPTGALHLGNTCTFFINWALARQNNWELILRMEDLVGPRIDRSTINDTLQLLSWLELDWDGDMILQSENLTPYRQEIERLRSVEKVYHCDLSRKEIELVASAPHADDPFGKEYIRPDDVNAHNSTWNGSPTNWRFIVSDGPHIVQDRLRGTIAYQHLDDFVVWTRTDMPAYQLAVVVDDAREGITDVVRGSDLLESAAWQAQLYKQLGTNPPNWWHLPLVIGEDGRRLAKRHGDTRLRTYQNEGLSPHKIIGLVAKWCHLIDSRASLSANEFLSVFDISKVPVEDIVYTEEDTQWLHES